MMGGSGISWTICKSFAPHSRQITMPVPHHSIFYGPDALPDAQPTVSKHWRQIGDQLRGVDSVSITVCHSSWQAHLLTHLSLPQSPWSVTDHWCSCYLDICSLSCCMKTLVIAYWTISSHYSSVSLLNMQYPVIILLFIKSVKLMCMWGRLSYFSCLLFDDFVHRWCSRTFRQTSLKLR